MPWPIALLFLAIVVGACMLSPDSSVHPCNSNPKKKVDIDKNQEKARKLKYGE